MSRIFGTDGVRGIANTELTSELAYNLGRAGAFVLTEGTHKPKILVAKDTRVSGDMLEAALVAGILSVGAEAVMIGVVPTPAVAYLTREYNADAGVMISASHNPVEYNGIKFFDNRGYKLSDELEDKIQKTIEDGFVGVPSPIGKDLGKCHFEADGINKYMEHAKSTIATELTGLKVALDCANGAAYEVAVNAFKSLGAEVHVINNTPDGTNINENCGSTHPEALMEYVVREKCDVGFAFDGDADRCLAVDEKGNLINGDFILTICAKALKEKGQLKDDTLVVTVMSNLGLDIACKAEEIRTLKVAEGNKEKNKTLSELASIMKELPQVLVNAKVPNHKKNIYLEDEEVVEAIKAVEDKLNGVGRVLIRPSGTEPLVRVMLEGENQEEINEMAHSIVNLILSKI